MSLTFYFAPMSTASITEAVLAELSAPFERVQLSIEAGDTRTTAFLKVNPNGRVPAIVHEGTSIWESSAITMYLGETFGVDAGLYPTPGPKRGEAMKWIAWSNVSLAEAGSRLASSLAAGSPGGAQPNSKDWDPAEQGNARLAEKARRDLADWLEVLDGGLAKKSFLLGEYSLVDTHLCGIVGWLGMMHVDMQQFANVTGWMQRCGQRPVFAQMMAG